jgi:hypothetical protein
MADLVEQALIASGPCLSTDLAAALVQEHGLSPAAARQRISRHQGIKRLAYLTFPRNARFLYLQKDYASDYFWDALTRALLDNSVAQGGALAALIARQGIMPVSHFRIACGAPLAQKRHLSPDTILQRLKQANLVKEVDVPGLGICVSLAQQYAPSDYEIARMRARLITEDVLLKAIKMWARNLGLVSYNLVALRGDGPEAPKVGTFGWDLTAPSYLSPMLEWKNSSAKPGFLACDVLMDRTVSDTDLRPFLNKCTTLRSLKRIGRCLHVFVADGYDEAAFKLAKSLGIVPATPKTLFGREVADGLTRLIEVLAHAADMSLKPQDFDELFKRLGKIEGAAVNLRGALFEYIAAEMIRQTMPATVHMNRVFKDAGGQQAEVDIVAVVASGSVYFIECKGYQPGSTVPDDMVKTWLEERVPFVRGWAIQHPDWRDMELHFEFWTTGKLSIQAKALIDAAKQKIKPTKYIVDVRDREALTQQVKAIRDPHLKRTLQQHFLKHPLNTADLGSKHPAKPAEIAGDPF